MPSTSILPPVQHGALKDSSLAAYTLNDGSRSLVFQDSNGTVRQLIYTQGSSAWTANSAFAVIATDAKNSTPLAVAVVPQQIEDTTHVYVIYITVNNTLAAKRLITGGSNNLNSISWDIPDPNLSGAFADLSDFAVSKSSKQLSVSVLPNTTNLEVCLFYENPHGNLSIVHGELLPQPGTTQLLWSWTNVSTDQMIFKTVVIGNATLGPPFSSGIVSISEPLSDTDQFYSISKNLSHLSLTYTYGRPDAFGIMESYYANNSLAEGRFPWQGNRSSNSGLTCIRTLQRFRSNCQFGLRSRPWRTVDRLPNRVRSSHFRYRQNQHQYHCPTVQRAVHLLGEWNDPGRSSGCGPCFHAQHCLSISETCCDKPRIERTTVFISPDECHHHGRGNVG